MLGNNHKQDTDSLEPQTGNGGKIPPLVNMDLKAPPLSLSHLIVSGCNSEKGVVS